MLDNIKKRIAEQTKDVIAMTKAADDDTMLVAEYAHLFQELSDLSIEGDGDSGAKIDILLTGDGKLSVGDDLDDVVLDEIGYNLKTGTLDVPADAAIKTEYAAMKSEDDFYTESTNLFQESDESNEEYEARCAQYADKNWKMYRQQVLQEGMFGYKRVNVTSEKVPSLATINFGNYNGSAYNVRMPIQHQVDKKGNLTRHQLESIYLAESCGLCENLMDEVKKDLCERYHISESASIWDTMIPSVLVAPVDPIDKHSIVVGFKNDANLAGMDFYRFTNPVCEYATGDTTLEHAAVERLDNAKVRELSKFCITRNAALKEAQKETPHFHRGFFQEAIDLGGDNQNANADNGGNNGVESTNSGSTDGGDNSNANADGQQQNEAPKVEVGKNDVSDAIVQKAQDETTKNETPDDTTVEGQDAITDIDNAEVPSLDDGSTDDGVEGTDMNATPDGEATDADIDQQLNDLNSSGEESQALDGDLSGDEIDMENMSIDEMLKMGTERLKGMSMSQLKVFLANNDAAAVQEAFILTNANINDEVDILLKKTLGVLNDNKMEIGQLVNEFKKYGKKLNRVLSKASKATKVYNDNEIDNIKKLNKCLTDLMITIKASTDKSSIQVIKRLMKAFTSQAAVVGKIVEKKKKELPEAKVKETKKKAVQESATMSSLLDIIAD